MKHILTEKEVQWAYEKWCLGYNLVQIADALYCCQNTVSRSFKRRNLERIRPILKAPEEVLGK